MPNEPLERLSDAELRRLLAENNFPNVPVTETTRKILIRKLRSHLNNEKVQKQRRRTTNVKTTNAYDDEESENEFNGYNISPRQHHYSTTGDTYLSPPLSTQQQQLQQQQPANNLMGPPLQPAMINRPRPDYTHQASAPFMGRPSIRNPLEHGIYSNYGMPAQQLSPPLATQQPRTSTSKMCAPPPILASESEEESDYLNYTANTSNIGSIRRGLTSLKNSLESNSYSPNGNPNLSAHNQHFGVVSRLLSLRDTTLRKSAPACNMNLPTNDEILRQRYSARARTLNNNNISNKYNTVNAPRSLLSRFKGFFDFQQGLKQTLVPYALICGLVAFLSIIVFVYIMKSPDLPNSINENNTQFTLCTEIDQLPAMKQLSTQQNCIEKKSVSDAIKMLQQLIRMLQLRAEEHYCKHQKPNANVAAIEFVRQLYEHGGGKTEVRRLLLELQNTEYLIEHNPQWRVEIIKDADTKKALGADDSDKILSQQQHQFVLHKPSLPLRCSLYKKVQRFFLIIGAVALIGGVGFIIFMAYRYIRGWQNDRLMAVEQFTTDIINELLYRASLGEAAEEREVIINHLRDKLLPLTKRGALIWSWNEALRLLEANDSRIQFGVTMRNGEEFRTMKWTGNVNVDTRERSPCTKKWQSPAFDAEKITNPPTPCLKIRHMFDAAEANHPQLKQVIEKAILEKVGPNCNIHDIQLDKQTCCVYVRCASEKDAGIVHNAINGWWFDNHLVSIKFLRLPRYMSRFPNSTTTEVIRQPTAVN